MKLFTPVLFLIVILLAGAMPAWAQTANFTADVNAGCPPLVVHFTNTTGCASCTYTWDLGNGTPPSSGTDASGSYLTTGTYTATLTVHNGSTTTIKTMVITVYPLPTVSFTASDTSVCPGEMVTFNSTSSGGTPGPMTSTWNFGDGGSGTGTPINHAFTSPGFYNVTLSVTNSQGCNKSLTRNSYVHVLNPPVPGFTASPTHLCTPPATTTFTGTATGSGPFTYAWTFGDGGTGGTSPITHTYGSTGSYNVTLVVTDGNGCKDTLTQPSYITVSNLTASFTLPSSACVGAGVSFTNTSSPHISSTWWFGDGGTSPGESPTHPYGTAGTYTVTLVVSDGTCTDTVTHTITINPAPVGSFTISPARPCPVPVTLSYTSTAPAGTTVNWNFSDGGSPTGTSTTHTYTGTGIYTVTMTLTNPTTGCVTNVVQLDTMYDLGLTVNATPISGCVPLTTTFTAFAYTTSPYGVIAPYPYGPTTYSWNFGDGGTGASAPVSHTYTAIGIYTAVVTATTNNGCTITRPVIIHVGAPPQATFTAAPTHVCYGKSVTFTPTLVSGPIDTLKWEFGDGSVSIYGGGISNTTHNYTLPGVFTVTLTPYYNGCPGVPFIITNYITVDSPKAAIQLIYSCANKTQVNFIDVSLGDNSRTWLFGDGGTATTTPITHTYPALGDYIATLATYNANSGCRDTATTNVHLLDLTPNFTSPDTFICKYGTSYFTSVVTGGLPLSYKWYVDGLTRIYWDQPNLLDTFLTTGLHTVMLVTVDEHGCKDTMLRPNYIHVAKPVPAFTGSPVSGCWPLTVAFTDASTDIAGVTLSSYAWTYGDGGTGTVTSTPVSHTYTASGIYPVTEIVTDNLGCKDTLTRPAYITVYRPKAQFNASTTHACLGINVNFTNTSLGGVVSSFWWFGDGATSTSMSPSHAYTATGSYTVKLAVTDAHGCNDTMIMATPIGVTKPHAGFNLSDSFSVCPPLSVNFTNTSTGATGYNWIFGDGNNSIVPSPSNMYISTGSYTVMLVATDVYGCKDTARRHISVYGYAGAFSYSPLTGCAPLTVNFTATVNNVTSITWDFADGTTSVTPTSVTNHNYVNPGAYVPKLILSDNTGCQNYSMGLDTIKVDKVTPKIGFSGPVCLDLPFNFIDSSTSYWSTITTRSWSYDGNSSTAATVAYTFTATGTYPVQLTVTDGWGCTGSLLLPVVIDPPPTIVASPDTVVCVGDHATLYGYGGVSYLWTADPTLSCTACNPTQASPTVPTMYTVTGTDAHGCTNIDSVRVSLRTKTFAAAWPDTAVCRGVPVPMHDTGATSWNWTPAFGLNDPSSGDPIATPASSQTYTVIAQLAGCIPDTDYVSLIIYQLPTVDAGVDQRLLAGTPAQLTAIGTLIARYSWTPTATLSCNTCANPLAMPDFTTSYRVDVISDHGCPASDSVTIHLFCDNSQIFIPNSFTPNGDGQNDVFYPRGKGVKNVNTFRIYNRWGELVYERDNIDVNDPSVGWDGSYKGNPPRPDVYVYLIEADCSAGDPIHIKGDITIIK
jgi:gliding motility-associated-like protein